MAPKLYFLLLIHIFTVLGNHQVQSQATKSKDIAENNVNYTFVSKPKLNWDDAAKACESRNMVLASARTQNEAKFFRDLANNHSFDREYTWNYWLAGKLSGGSYVWIQDNSTVADYFWFKDPPTTTTGQRCVSLYHHLYEKDQGDDDQPCTRKYGYVCRSPYLLCEGKECGRYSDPKSCNGYIICKENNTMEHATCPRGLAFRNDTNQCDLASKSKCGSSTGCTTSAIYPLGRLGKKVSVKECTVNGSTGEPWTEIQHRESGPQDDFNRKFAEYDEGFGDVDKNYWIGLKAIHALTKKGNFEARFDLEDWDGNKKFAQYSKFQVTNQSDCYRLWIAGYSGDAGDALTYSDGACFTAIDLDNDSWAPGNCASQKGGAWWHRACARSALNGLYYDGGTAPLNTGVYWSTFKAFDYSLKKTSIKIRKLAAPIT